MQQSESIQIYLNSRYATEIIDDNTADCVYYLPVIEIPDGHHIYLSLQTAQIPYSFYSITSVDNVFEFGLVGDPPTIYYIPPGNYNITQIIDIMLLTMGANFTITYSTTTSKLLFTHSTSNFTIYANTFNHAIGFSKSTDTTSQANILYSRDVVNLNQIRALNIECNFPTGNVNVAQTNNSNILATIPVYVAPFSIITYQNPNNFRTNLYVNKLDQIQIKITSNDGNLINLNGINYQMTLQLDCIKFTE
tara:strand:- start:767 stop:1513 length:747 start_codon:yes stop_codon:yes gene_type:complete